MSRSRLEVVRTFAASMVVASISFAPAKAEGSVLAGPEAGPDASVSPGEPSDTERARELADRARRLYWNGEYERAIEVFESAYEIVPDPNVLYNISAAYEKLGRHDRALEYLDLYEANAPDEEQAAIDARRRELLEAKSEADARRPEPEPKPEPKPEPVESLPPPREPKPRPPLMGALGWSLVGVAGAGVAVGAGFGIASLIQSDRGRDECVGDASALRCPTSARSTLDAANRNAIIADVGFGVAVLAAAAVVTVVGVRLKKRKRAAVDVSLRGAGAAVHF